MQLNTLKPGEGAREDRKRVGRGIGSGLGKTCGRGHKGSFARSGKGKISAGFEGGQMPMQKRLPKVGFRSKIKKDTAEVLLYQLDKLEAGEIDLAALYAARLIPRTAKQAKIVVRGELTKKFVLKGLLATAGAKAAIIAAGGQVGSSTSMARSGNAMTGVGGGLGKFTELRQRLLFVVGALIVYRIGCYIPVPGVNPDAMLQLMETQRGTIVDMFNMFSGGALERFSLLALNVMPYISSSIIMQLMVQMVPSMKAIQKEGESGRRKINQWSRMGAIPLAVFQAWGIATALQAGGASQGIPVVYSPGPGFVMTAVIALTAGTMFLMWLGEQVTERGIGNGVSLIIFAGIVAGLPSAVLGMSEQIRNGDMSALTGLAVAAIVFVFTYFVVFVERGQRRITVNYARRQGGRSAYLNQSSFLPLKLNMSGVIPAIFASSIVMFPATAATWFSQGDSSSWMLKLSQWLNPGEPLHMILYAGLISGFAFFYTALVFNSQETADNLKKSGALIPGIRPGKATADYVDGVLTRLTAAGAVYLVLVCLLPEVMRTRMGTSFYFGGTSLLIVVVVVMDFIAQIQAHLMSHQYESLLKKANLKGGSRGGLARG